MRTALQVTTDSRNVPGKSQVAGQGQITPRTGPRKVLQESNMQSQGSLNLSIDISSMNSETLVEYINEHIARRTQTATKASKVFKSSCTKYFERLYALGQMPLYQILNLHTKYLLKLVDISASGVAEEFYLVFKALCGVKPTTLGDLLFIRFDALETESLIQGIDIKTQVSPGLTQLAKAIVSFQSLALKYLVNNPVIIKKIGESNLVRSFNESNGSPVYWSGFLQINDKLNRLSTLSKFAYQFSALVPSARIDLLLASVRLCPLPSNAKTLHDHLTKTDQSSKVIATKKKEFEDEARKIFPLIQPSSALFKDLRILCPEITPDTSAHQLAHSDTQRKRLAGNFRKHLEEKGSKSLDQFLTANYVAETSAHILYDALVVLNIHLSTSPHKEWASYYMDIADHFVKLSVESCNWSLVAFTSDFMSKYSIAPNTETSNGLQKLVDFDQVAFYGSSKAVYSKSMLHRTKSLLSLAIRNPKQSFPHLKVCLKFAFDLLEREYGLDLLAQSKSLEQILAIQPVEDIILISAQSMVYCDVDMDSGETDNVPVIIYELVLSVLWRSSSKYKLQICNRLFRRIAQSMSAQEHPVRLCRAVYFYYNSTGGQFPDHQFAVDGQELNAYLTDVLNGPELGLDHKLESTMLLLRAFLSVVLCMKVQYSRKAYERATKSLVQYFSSGGKLGSTMLEKQLDMFVSVLGSSNAYDLQVLLLRALVNVKECPSKYEAYLAEAYLAIGQTKKCCEIVSQLQKSATPKSLLSAKIALIGVNAFIADYQISAADTALVELDKLMKEPEIVKEGIIKSVQDIKQSKRALGDLHPKVLLFCEYLLTQCDLVALKLKKEQAVKVANGLTRFISTYLKSIQAKEELPNAIDIRPVVTLLVRAATKSAEIYEMMGVVSASIYRFNMISKFVTCGDDMWTTVSFRWSSALQLETLVKRQRYQEGRALLDKVRDHFLRTGGDSDPTSIQRRYAYNMVELAVKSLDGTVDNLDSELQSLMRNMSLNGEDSNAIIRYEMKDILVETEHCINTLDYPSAKNCIAYGKKLSESYLDVCSPERLRLQILDAKLKYKESLQMVNVDPIFSEIYKGSVLMVPSVRKPLNKEYKAVKLLREAEFQLTGIRDLIFYNCGVIVLQELADVQIEIGFLLNAFSCHVDPVSSYYLPQIVKDLPYSIRSGRFLEYNEDQLDIRKISGAGHTKISLADEGFDRGLLPEGWIVVSLQYASESKALVATRFTKNEDPISLRIPSFIDRFTDDEEDCFTFAEAKKMIQAIILESSYQVPDAASITEDDKHKWWTAKFNGDKELRLLMKKAAYSWFGGFKAIFGNPAIQLPQGFYDSIDDVFRKYLRGRLGATKRVQPNRKGHVELDPMVYRLLALAMTVNSQGTRYFEQDKDEEWEDDDRLMEDLVNLVLDMLFLQGEKNPYDEIDIDHLVVEIEEVVSRYVGVNLEPPNHTVLVVDRECHDFPWESLPFFMDREVTRVPSMGVLQRLLEKNPRCELPLQNALYILNPSKDLTATEKRMNQALATMDQSICDWKGYSGVVPDEREFVHSLENACDLYVYMGHGGGRNCIRRSDIEGLSNCPATMLFGCRSCDIESEGLYESSGNPLSYLAAGCPMLLCSLFNVTDKDTDLHTERILRSWTDKSKGMTVTRALNESRKCMKLTYLNGAAFVVYGLPLKATECS